MSKAKPKILIVDDEPDVRELIHMTLSEGSYELIEAGDGEEALKKIKSKSPDLLILDLILPGLDGWDVCQELRRMRSKMPVILLTKKPAKSGRWKSMPRGRVEYVTKPFETDRLIEIVKKLLSE